LRKTNHTANSEWAHRNRETHVPVFSGSGFAGIARLARTGPGGFQALDFQAVLQFADFFMKFLGADALSCAAARNLRISVSWLAIKFSG
jgi:hypothetical protein